jgi:hypothetical protein
VAGLDGVEMLDVERVLAGVWRRGEQAVEAHCPFLRLTVSGDDEPALAGMRRDLEHVGTLWGPLADKVVRTAESGRVQYSGDKSVPVEWSRPFQPEFMTDELRTALLRSGSNYHAARAVGSFFHEPDRDFTDLLAAEGTGVPVCHTTLHMIRAYARLKRNPEIAAWYRAHTRLAEGYADNGEAFRLRYLRTLEESLAEVRAFAGRDAA